ncbi:hypothetical protein GH714_018458 [Hevea brasiliensis]|uniref:Uncharacterized protein n=1 Tax=Hevea brasiliensis TaxID=3981 RepID=A0A6A6N234_HEVBR|nr:hypothetical protein GH714_018458 [Hevea brasiliensis]
MMPRCQDSPVASENARDSCMPYVQSNQEPEFEIEMLRREPVQSQPPMANIGDMESVEQVIESPRSSKDQTISEISPSSNEISTGPVFKPTNREEQSNISLDSNLPLAHFKVSRIMKIEEDASPSLS